MMQEDELVSKDEMRNEDHIDVKNMSGQEIFPLSLPGRPFNIALNYNYTKYEIFVATVVMFSTISGGFLEGYTSPAIPSLLNESSSHHLEIEDELSDTKYINFSHLSLNSLDKLNSTSVTMSQNIANTSVALDLNEELEKKNISSFINTTTTATVPTDTTKFQQPVTETLNISNVGKDIFKNNNISEISTSHSEKTITKDYLKSEEGDSQPKETTIEPLPSPLPYSDDGNITIKNGSDLAPGSIRISAEEASWLGSLLLLGACVGAVFSPWTVALGRRHAILFSAIPRIAGWILIAASSSLSTIYAGRFITGISLGVVTAAIPIYISEVSHPSLRGCLSCVVQLGVNIGMFLATLLGTFMGWRTLAVFGALTVTVYFILSFFIPNSPSWLILRGRESEAREVLKKLRARDYSVEEELQQIITIAEKDTQHRSISWLNLLRERRSVMPLLVVILVTLVNRFSGYNAIITYCSTFLHQAVPTISQYFAAVAVCFVQIIATVAAIKLVDSWGRRKLLLLSVSVMAVALLLIALCEKVIVSHGAATWVAVLATMVYVGSYSLGIGPLTWVLLGELLPLDARDKGSAIVAVLNWFTAFVVTKTYFSLESTAGITGTCVLYSAVCVMGVVLMYFLVPETKGRTLTEIEIHFSYSRRSWKPSVPHVDRSLSGILDQDVATIDTYSTFH